MQEQPITLQSQQQQQSSTSSSSPLKAASAPTTTSPQQLTFEQAQLGGDLAKVAQAKGLSLQNLSSEDLNQLLAPNSSQPLDPKGLNTLSSLAWNLDSAKASDLLKVLGSLDPDSRRVLLTQLAALDDPGFNDLLKLIESLDRASLGNLFTQLGNNNSSTTSRGDFADLLNLIGFFNLHSLSKADLDDLFTVRRFFDLRDLRDLRDLEDRLRLLRFFGVDDLHDLRFRIDRIRSGRASPSINISNTGDNVNLCLGIQQVVNTGNVANQQGVFQYNSNGGADGDGFVLGDDRGFIFGGDRVFGDRFGFFDDFDRRGDIDFEGSSIEINPGLVVQCQQTINQAVASGNPLAQAFVQGAAPAAVAVPVAAVASGVGAAPSVGVPAAPGAGLGQLPRTGGLPLPLAVVGLAGAGAGLALWRHRR